MWHELTAANEMTMENEVQDFLYGLVRLVKPTIVVETGCYEGMTSAIVGDALRENEFGTLYTCDTDPHCVFRAKSVCNNPRVIISQETGLSLLRGLSGSIDLAILDSGTPESRIEEALEIHARGDNATVVLHDACKDSLKALSEIRRLTGWQNRVFTNGRGLAVFWC